jgi:hypothetical protein
MKAAYRKKLFLALGALAALAMSYCFWAYFHLRGQLVPTVTEITPQIEQISIGIVISIFLVAVFHLLLLALSLRLIVMQEQPHFHLAAFFAGVIVSGITILSDIALLHDLGREYLYWDIHPEWNLLLVLSAFQMLVMLTGLVLQVRTAPQPDLGLFNRIRRGDDVLFITLNQVGLICGLAGLASLALPYVMHLSDRFVPLWMLTLAGLAAAPLIIMAVYWLLRNRSKKLEALLDEKQFMDVSFGALLSTALMVTVLIVYLLLRGPAGIDLNHPIYILGLIFSAFFLVFATVLLRFN